MQKSFKEMESLIYGTLCQDWSQGLLDFTLSCCVLGSGSYQKLQFVIYFYVYKSASFYAIPKICSFGGELHGSLHHRVALVRGWVSLRRSNIKLSHDGGALLFVRPITTHQMCRNLEIIMLEGLLSCYALSNCKELGVDHQGKVKVWNYKQGREPMFKGTDMALKSHWPAWSVSLLSPDPVANPKMGI